MSPTSDTGATERASEGGPSERPREISATKRAIDEAAAERPSRGYQRSAPALIGAMLAVMGLIVAIWALSRFQHRDLPDPARPVNYTAQLAVARQSAPFDVLAPASTPPGWRATSVSWDGQPPDLTWHLGFLTAQDQYVGLEQGSAPSAAFVAASTSATEPGQPVKIGGQRWQTLSSTDSSVHALVRRTPGVTTVVTGTAAESQLESFAGSLESR
jgi:Protein of unknown function (DUF4245)